VGPEVVLEPEVEAEDLEGEVDLAPVEAEVGSLEGWEVAEAAVEVWEEAEAVEV
jgi:hypothetical protein